MVVGQTVCVTVCRRIDARRDGHCVARSYAADKPNNVIWTLATIAKIGFSFFKSFEKIEAVSVAEDSKIEDGN